VGDTRGVWVASMMSLQNVSPSLGGSGASSLVLVIELVP